MSEVKRGYVVMIQGGDPEISGAIAEGIKAGMGAELIRPGERGRLLEIRKDDWDELAKLVKVAIGNTKTCEDYAILRAAAEQEYRMPQLSQLRRVRERLLAIYALAWFNIREYFNWEGAKWRGV